MNPWATENERGQQTLGGLRDFVRRQELTKTPGLFVDTESAPSMRRMRRIDELLELQRTTLERMRELECLERTIAAAGVLLPRQLEARIETIRVLGEDLEHVLASKDVILRTLQRNVASEYLDVEMTDQRQLIGLFHRLCEELPRFAATVATPDAMQRLASDLHQRHGDHARAVDALKTSMAKLHAVRDDMGRLRARYAALVAEHQPPGEDSAAAEATAAAARNPESMSGRQ